MTKKKFFFFFKIIIYLLVILLLSKKININQLSNLTTNINFYFFYLSVPLFSLIFFLQSFYNYKLTNIVSKLDISYYEWVKIFYKSSLFNSIIPFAGTAYRAVILKKTGLSYKFFIYILTTIALFYFIFFFFLFIFFVLFFKYNIFFSLVFLFLVIFIFSITKKYIFLTLKYFNFNFLTDLRLVFYKNIIILFFLQFIFDFIVFIVCIYVLNFNYSIDKLYYIFSTNYFLDRVGFYNYPGFGEYFMGIFFQYLGFAFLSGAILKVIIRVSQWLSLLFTFVILSLYVFAFKYYESNN